MELELTDIVLRLAIAAAAGIAVGLNRDMLNKPLGMRTLALVALGSALVPLAALQFENLADHPDALSRVMQGSIQGIMVGIGFVGAGAILRDGAARTVEGLTTAATVWVTAGLGIACGLAEWQTVAVAVVLALVVLIGVGRIERAVWRDGK